MATLVSACLEPAQPGADAPLDTVEIGEPLDAELSFEDDPTRAATGGGVVGLLPGDFPRDLQPYAPSSLTDFGRAGTGRRYVELSTADSPRLVKAHFVESARLEGWELQAISAPEGPAYELTKVDRRVRVLISEAGAETRIRIEYPAQ